MGWGGVDGGRDGDSKFVKKFWDFLNDCLDFVIAGKFIALENVEAEIYFCWGENFNKTVRLHGLMMGRAKIRVKKNLKTEKLHRGATTNVSSHTVKVNGTEGSLTTGRVEEGEGYSPRIYRDTKI